jgi:hypothetical protein
MRATNVQINTLEASYNRSMGTAAWDQLFLCQWQLFKLR